METVRGFSLGNGSQKKWERRDRTRKAVVEEGERESEQKKRNRSKRESKY